MLILSVTILIQDTTIIFIFYFLQPNLLICLETHNKIYGESLLILTVKQILAIRFVMLFISVKHHNLLKD